MQKNHADAEEREMVAAGTTMKGVGGDLCWVLPGPGSGEYPGVGGGGECLRGRVGGLIFITSILDPPEEPENTMK